jgi:hypothetical protein
MHRNPSPLAHNGGTFFDRVFGFRLTDVTKMHQVKQDFRTAKLTVLTFLAFLMLVFHFLFHLFSPLYTGGGRQIPL